MPVFPNLRRSGSTQMLAGQSSSCPAPDTPITYVDTPGMDYVAWLKSAGSAIAGFGPTPPAMEVAVIGSGAAGLAAAYELLRCGINVTVYEATDRIGGRLFTSPSSTGDGNLFEMGAMRFTPSEQVLHYYADVFNAANPGSVLFDNGPFPDPGVNNTYITFQGQTYRYVPGQPNQLPPSYTTCGDGWAAFMCDGFTSHDGTLQLVAPNTITQWLSDPGPNQAQVVAAWSQYIQAFANRSLYEAVVRIFTDPNAPGGQPWSETDLEFFGALGTGFGGFGPLFPIGFLDIMRFVINAVDSDQHELVTGVHSIVDGFLHTPIEQPNGTTVTLADTVVRNTPVSAMVVEKGGVTVRLANGNTGFFDRVVVATSHRSMEITMGLGVSRNGTPLAEPVADAVRRVHLENSSKVFVETQAYWTQTDPSTGSTWPRNVVGDTLLRNFYTLTYDQPEANPPAPQGTGAILFSYTWADDSVKQQTIADPQARLELLMRDLEGVSPDLAQVVAASIDAGTAQVIDWQNEPYFFGAFKLNQPGQDGYVQSLFYDFRKAGQSGDTFVYLAGDSIGFLGGWVENALQTGVNAAAAVAVSLGGTLNAGSLSPFACLDPSQYDYSGGPVAKGTIGRIQVPAIVSDAVTA